MSAPLVLVDPQVLRDALESLQELRPHAEDFSWGPTLGLAEQRRTHAIRRLRKALKTGPAPTAEPQTLFEQRKARPIRKGTAFGC